MAYRNLFVESPARISLKSGRLVIAVKEEWSVPLEDVDALLIESRQSIVTAAALSALAENGTVVYFCNEKHLPGGILLPYAGHSRFLTVLSAQQCISEPRKKRLWQQIVRAKIRNQASCLELCGRKKGAEELFAMAARVQSGDGSRLEAAAAFYFPALFGAGFARGDETEIVNSALNYGYAILRGAVARKLACYGFTLCLGLNHRSALNAMNLADDIIEPFRPAADLLVAQKRELPESLTPDIKHELFGLLNIEMLSGGQYHSLSYAVDRLVQSLIRAINSVDEELVIPELLPIRQHAYE